MNSLKMIKEKLTELTSLVDAALQEPAKFDFQSLPREKKARVERFEKALLEGKAREVKQKLELAGWARGMNNEITGVSTWGTKAKPGYILTIKAGAFTVTNGSDVKLPATPLRDLEAFLTNKNF